MCCKGKQGFTRESISKMNASLLLKIRCLYCSIFFPFDSFTEARVSFLLQEDQQHFQHRGNHLQHERSQRSRTDNRLQECHIHIHIHPIPAGPRDPAAQNGWWICTGGWKKVIQSCQQSGQDLSYHLSSALLHLQPGLLGHLRQQKASHQPVQPTEMNMATENKQINCQSSLNQQHDATAAVLIFLLFFFNFIFFYNHVDTQF